MTTRRVLMLAPSFLADRRHKRIHGAEVFNLALVRQLLGAGVSVTVAAEPMWQAEFERHWGDLLSTTASPATPGRLTITYGLHLRKPLPTSLSVVAQLLRDPHPPFDLLILGNVARGILPAARLLRTLGRVRRTMVISHQYPRPEYARAMAKQGIAVMAVSQAVARCFRDEGCADVWVRFGIGNPDDFKPAAPPLTPAPPRSVRFGLVGQLDTPWKGADTVLHAWSNRPPHLRGLATLHLCAYSNGPPNNWSDPDAVFHDWLPPSAVGDFMRTLDVLIVPSTSSETFSQVMVQGMLAGLPIISSSLEVLTEKLDTGGGLIFHTPAELTAHIAMLATDSPARRAMGEHARQVAVERYVWRIDDFVARYLNEARA